MLVTTIIQKHRLVGGCSGSWYQGGLGHSMMNEDLELRGRGGNSKALSSAPSSS